MRRRKNREPYVGEITTADGQRWRVTLAQTIRTGERGWWVTLPVYASSWQNFMNHPRAPGWSALGHETADGRTGLLKFTPVPR